MFIQHTSKPKNNMFIQHTSKPNTQHVHTTY